MSLQITCLPTPPNYEHMVRLSNDTPITAVENWWDAHKPTLIQQTTDIAPEILEKIELLLEELAHFSQPTPTRRDRQYEIIRQYEQLSDNDDKLNRFYTTVVHLANISRISSQTTPLQSSPGSAFSSNQPSSLSRINGLIRSINDTSRAYHEKLGLLKAKLSLLNGALDSAYISDDEPSKESEEV